MGRITRAKAAEVAEKLQNDEDAVLGPLSENEYVNMKAAAQNTPERMDRAPLAEIASNSGSNRSVEEDEAVGDLKKSTRNKKRGKKSAIKNDKAAVASSTAGQPDGSAAGFSHEVVPDKHEASSSPASEKAAEDLLFHHECQASTATPNLPNDDVKTVGPAIPAIGLTQDQFTIGGKAGEDVEAELNGLTEARLVQRQTGEPAAGHTNEEYDNSLESVRHVAVGATPSPFHRAVPPSINKLRKDSPSRRTVSNKENIGPDAASLATPRVSGTYDTLEAAVIQASTLSATSRQALQPSSAIHAPDQFPSNIEESVSKLDLLPLKPEDPITAMDTLDERVDQINSEIPDVRASPEKPKTTRKPWERPAPVVRATKASQARMSLAQGDKSVMSRTPSLGKPPSSAALDRSGSWRQSTTATDRVTSTSSVKQHDTLGALESKGEPIIPHSKQRPVSLSFPPPPPPAKSTKAPTRSTFQLPGEAISAKLRAQREERVSKEAEAAEARKSAFRARPVPAGLKRAPSVRQTSTSKARENLAGGKPAPPIAPANHRRTHTMPVMPTVAAPNSRLASKDGAATAAPATKRASMSVANISKPRASLFVSTASNAVALSNGVGSALAKGMSKGKEVFSRAANAKDAAEKEKREKEEAAKKARHEAAERGRSASREWAEKRRLKAQGPKLDEHPKVSGADVEQPVEQVVGVEVA